MVFKIEDYVALWSGKTLEETSSLITDSEREFDSFICDRQNEKFVEENYDEFERSKVFFGKAQNYIRYKKTGGVPPKDQRETDLLESLYNNLKR